MLVRRAAATTTRVAVHRIVAAGPTQRTTIVLVAGPAVAFGRRYPRRGTLGHPQRRESGPSFTSNAGAHFHAGLDASPAHGNVAHAEETDAQRTASQAGPWRTATQEQRGELRRATFPAKAPSCSIASQVPHTPSRRSRWTSLALTHVFTTHGDRAGACKPHCLAHGDPRSGGHSLGAQRHTDGPSYLRAQPWRTATQGWRRKDGPSAPARTQQLARLRTTVLYHCWQRPMGYADDPMLVAKQTDGRSALGRSHLLNVTA